MPEASSAYRGCRERITELASDAPNDALSRSVPACPSSTYPPSDGSLDE